jgi:hypothetical protein
MLGNLLDNHGRRR